jgi:hypothetical protein
MSAKRHQYLTYQEGSETIRQMPENYLIAKKHLNRWITDPDMACNKTLATKVFLALFDFDTAYGTGKKVLETANKIKPRSLI